MRGHSVDNLPRLVVLLAQTVDYRVAIYETTKESMMDISIRTELFYNSVIDQRKVGNDRIEVQYFPRV